MSSAQKIIQAAAGAGGGAGYNILYAVSDGDTLYSFDITDPESPTQLDSITSSTNFDRVQSMRLDRVNSVLYVAAITSGRVSSVDVSDPSNLTILGSVSTNAYAIDINIEHDLLVTADFSNDAINIYDISNPSNISFLGNYQSALLLDNPRGVAITEDGNTAYVSCYSDNSISAVDISNRASPVFLDENNYGSPGIDGPQAILLNSNESALFVADQFNGFFSLSESGLSQTSDASVRDQLGDNADVFAGWGQNDSMKSGYDPENEIIYLTQNLYDNSEYLVHRVNVSNTFNMSITGSYEIIAEESLYTRFINASLKQGTDYVFAGTGGSGVKVLNFSNPASPTLVTTLLSGNTIDSTLI